MSKLEDLFTLQIRALKLPEPVREYKFLKHRKFRFDFSWLDQKLAAEIDGATWTGGRHTRGKGYEQDCVKNALAILAGWRVFRFTGNQVKSGDAYRFIEQFFEKVGTEDNE